MTDQTVYKARTYCNDGIDLIAHPEEWYDILPTSCPLGITGHTFVNNVITESVSTKSGFVVEDTSGTHGYYRSDAFTFDVPAGITGEFIPIGDCSDPYPTRIYSITIFPGTENIGDYISMVSAPDTVVGILTAPVSGGTALAVNSTAINNINPGLLVNLFDGVTGQNLGQCVSVDKNTNTVIVDTPVSLPFSAGALVRISLRRLNNLRITNTNNITMGANTLGSTLSPPNIIGRIFYKNMTGDPKKFTFMAEMSF